MKPRKAVVPPYRNPKLAAAKRVKDLLSRMTLPEKAAQMTCVWQRKADTLVDATEKMSFRVTPVIPYLRAYPKAPKTEAPAKN